MSAIERKALLSGFQREMDSDSVALFIGAGMSRASGFVDWKGLMKEVADDLGLDINRETDLIALAQYHHNSRKTRHRINQLLVTEFTKGVTLTENHRLFASLPISTIWTTNYDRLIEDAFTSAGKRVDVKRRQADLPITKPRADVTVYKMHGDVDAPDDAVLTKDDYATFETHRNLFSVQLRGHLVSKSFLFLGYSFSDPNIDYILARIRAQLGSNKREHYCIMRKVLKGPGMDEAEVHYQTRKLTLRIEDLQNYGIQTLLVDDYAEITDLLRDLKRRAVRRNVFISGSAHDPAPMTAAALESFSRALGREIVRQDYNLISGLGLGIGGAVTMGALEQLYSTPVVQLEERLTLRPFPQVAPSSGSRDDIWERYRQDMISRAGFAAFIAGNRLDGSSGRTVDAQGVIREFEIAVAAGVYPIPIGATGSAAKALSDKVLADPHAYYGSFGPSVLSYLQILADHSAGETAWIDAVIGILRTVAPK